MTLRRVLFIIVLVGCASTAFPQGLTFVSGSTEKGLVKDLLPDGVLFMKMDTKQVNVSDDLITAQATKFSPKKVPYEEIKMINDVPTDAYRTLYNHNPLYRLVERMKYQWAMAMGRGDFKSQAKALFLFLLILGVLVPVFTWLGGKLAGSQSGMMGALGISAVIYALGYGVIKGFEMLTASGTGFLATGSGQMGALIGVLIVTGLLIGALSKDGIVSGLGMIVGWFVGIYGAIWALNLI